MTSLPTFKAFLKRFKPILYRRRERIVIPGQSNEVYFIAQGYVSQSVLSPNGNEFTPYIFAPEAFFPLILSEENELLDGDEYEFESLTPVEVYRIPKEELLQFLKEDANTVFAFNQQLTAYSAELLKKLETRVFSDAFHMVILGLLDLAKLFGSPRASLAESRRGEAGKNEGKEVVIEYWFTHQDIANISGLSREVVTKQMNKLMQKKLISYKSHFIILNNTQTLKDELDS